MRVEFIKVRKLILTLFAVLLLFGSGYYFGVKGYKVQLDNSLKAQISREVPIDKNIDFNLFWLVWDTLSSKYFDKSKLIPSEMVSGAISGMVASLGDPYTMFLPPKENKVVDDDLKGKFEGVGIEIGFKDTTLAVVSPLPGSPAERAGVKAGDLILHIKDETKKLDISTDGITLPDAVSAIRGPAGTKVSLTLLREGVKTPLVIELTRETLNIASVTFEWVGANSDIAKIKVAKFGAETASEWEKAITEYLSNGNAKGIIIDVRNNPGGYLQAAIDIASDFVENGTTIVIQENGDKSKQEFESQKLPRLLNQKAVVLINGGSASASEILSGALRDLRSVKLIGEKTFGKGTIQEPVEIQGGAGLHVTVAKWLTPKGTWVHGEGLIPDEEVKNPEDNAEDLQLKAAIENFK